MTPAANTARQSATRALRSTSRTSREQRGERVKSERLGQQAGAFAFLGQANARCCAWEARGRLVTVVAERQSRLGFRLWRDAQMAQSLARHNRVGEAGYGVGTILGEATDCERCGR